MASIYDSEIDFKCEGCNKQRKATGHILKAGYTCECGKKSVATFTDSKTGGEVPDVFQQATDMMKNFGKASGWK